LHFEKGGPILSIRFEKIIKRYRNRFSLDGVSIIVNTGHILGVYGGKDSGKSLFTRIAAGVERPDSGNVFCDDRSIYDSIASYRKKIGYLPESYGVYDNLRVRDYLTFFGRLADMSEKEASAKVDELLERADLKDASDEYTDAISLPVRQKMMIVRTFMSDPQIIIMDEPGQYLSTEDNIWLAGNIKKMWTDKTGIIASQDVKFLSETCTDLLILDNGKKVLSGSMDSINRRIEENNPVYIHLLDAEEAVSVLKVIDQVKSISIDGNTVMAGITGGREIEASVLRKLVEAGINVSGFERQRENMIGLFYKLLKGEEL
jgi:ABC-2 type transport system ATP-binding protein